MKAIATRESIIALVSREHVGVPWTPEHSHKGFVPEGIETALFLLEPSLREGKLNAMQLLPDAHTAQSHSTT